MRSRQPVSSPTTVLNAIQRPLPAGQSGDSICLVEFDRSRFSTADFRSAGIDQPPQIAQSVAKRQAEFLVGRIAARSRLAALGIVQTQVGIGSARQPIWPAGVVGSISHTDSMAAAVVLPANRCVGVGIDLEQVADAQNQAALLSVVNQRELAQLSRSSNMMPLATLLTIVFSAKESFYKGAYGVVRRFFDFDCAELSGINVRCGWLCLKLTEDLCAELPCGSEHRVHFELIEPQVVITSYCWLRRD